MLFFLRGQSAKGKCQGLARRAPMDLGQGAPRAARLDTTPKATLDVRICADEQTFRNPSANHYLLCFGGASANLTPASVSSFREPSASNPSMHFSHCSHDEPITCLQIQHESAMKAGTCLLFTSNPFADLPQTFRRMGMGDLGTTQTGG